MEENEQAKPARKPRAKETKPRKPGGGRKPGSVDLQPRKKETKPRRPGGGRKKGSKDTRPRKPETKPRKSRGVKRVLFSRSVSFSLTVKREWYAEHKAVADSEGISLAEHVRRLLKTSIE